MVGVVAVGDTSTDPRRQPGGARRREWRTAELHGRTDQWAGVVSGTTRTELTQVKADRCIHPRIFSSPFLSESLTFVLLGCNSEPSFEVVNDTLDDEFAELLPPEA